MTDSPRPPEPAPCQGVDNWCHTHNCNVWACPVPAPTPEPGSQEATHRCKVCGAHWRLNKPWKEQPEGSWSLVYPFEAGTCCDNMAMGDQIEPLPASEADCWCGGNHGPIASNVKPPSGRAVSGEPEGEVPMTTTERIEAAINLLYERAVAMHESIERGDGATGWQDAKVRNILESLVRGEVRRG
jgi:hypothetical protein